MNSSAQNRRPGPTQPAQEPPAVLKLVQPQLGEQLTIDVAKPGALRLRLWLRHEWEALTPRERPARAWQSSNGQAFVALED